MDANTGTEKFMLKGNAARGAYAHSFGYLDDRTTYSDGFKGIDLRPDLKAAMDRGMEIAFKALTTESGGAGTAGYALIPVSVDPRIVDQSRKFTPWTELIPRVTNQGITADYNIITAKGAGFTALENAPMTTADDTEDRESEWIKYLYSVGSVTGQVQSAMPSYIIQGLQPSGTGAASATFGSPTAPNAKQYEVLKRAQALKELEENLIWNGNSTTDATQFNGIIAQQSTTNQTDKSSTALNWGDIEKSVEDAYADSGRVTISASDSSSLIDTRKIMIDSFRYKPGEMNGTAGFGVPARVVLETMTGPVPLIPSQYLSRTSGAKQMFFLDMEYVEMRVLQDMSYEDLAKENDSQRFMLKIYEALLVRAPLFNAFIDNIA